MGTLNIGPAREDNILEIPVWGEDHDGNIYDLSTWRGLMITLKGERRVAVYKSPGHDGFLIHASTKGFKTVNLALSEEAFYAMMHIVEQLDYLTYEGVENFFENAIPNMEQEASSVCTSNDNVQDPL